MTLRTFALSCLLLVNFCAPPVFMVLAASACAPPPSIQTPEGKKIWTANEVVIRINEFQGAVIDASDLGALPVPTARTIVEWTTRSLRTIQAVPDGWLPVVAKGWAEVRPLIAEHPKLGHWTLILDLMLGA